MLYLTTYVQLHFKRFLGFMVSRFQGFIGIMVSRTAGCPGVSLFSWFHGIIDSWMSRGFMVSLVSRYYGFMNSWVSRGFMDLLASQRPVYHQTPSSTRKSKMRALVGWEPGTKVNVGPWEDGAHRDTTDWVPINRAETSQNEHNAHRVAKCQFFLHRSILSTWIYPKKKRVNCNEFLTKNA